MNIMTLLAITAIVVSGGGVLILVVRTLCGGLGNRAALGAIALIHLGIALALIRCGCM